MDAKTLAAELDGSQYPFRTPFALEEQAEKDGLVIVFGASDDLMEFRGAIHDEIGALNGTTALIDKKGIIPRFECIGIGLLDEEERYQRYFERKPKGKLIEALWAPEGRNMSWCYKTDIPHETFLVYEDDDVYCEGIVFSLNDLGEHE